MSEGRKIALVVGGSRGIGKAIALNLAKSGFDIWLTYQSNHPAAEETKKEIESLGSSCRLFSFDISDYKATEEALAKVCDETPPHVLIYNAELPGIILWFG